MGRLSARRAGIFTRRAVKLLDNAEAKSVLATYEGDPHFATEVNRYIHDFEALLRQLLSTRDGHALGVTLLSSDVGKLMWRWPRRSSACAVNSRAWSRPRADE
jgi:hypothetical protein